MIARLATIISLIFGSSLLAAEPPKAPDAATVKLLQEFEASFEAKMKDVKVDDQFKTISAELKNLSQNLSDSQLPDVEHYALTKDGEGMRWWLAFFFVERGKLDSAAHLFVDALVRKKENRSYVMWKYWESCLGERKDFKELSRNFGSALVRQFEVGNAEYKQVVAELFGKGETEAKMSVEDFKKAIDFDKTIAK